MHSGWYYKIGGKSMGRRELLIALTFVAGGIVAYQFTAPPAKTGQGFSFARFFSAARRQVQSDRSQATYTQQGTLPVSPGLSEVRISHITHGVTIRGEARTDIAYELKVDSTGPDPETALSYAKRTTLTSDDLGTSLALGADYPAGGSQVAEVTLKVPSRLAARIDNSQSARIHISGLAGVRLDGGSGETVLEQLTGPVTGQLRTASLSIVGAPSVDLTLQAVNATLDGITHTVTLTARSGRCTLLHVAGAIEIDATNTEVLVTEPTGTIHIGATGGHLTVTDPTKQTDLEGRRTGIDVQMATAVPMTLLTTDEPLRLTFHRAPPAFALDALSSDGGTVRAEDPRLVPMAADHAMHLAHAFDEAATPRVVLRNSRGEIVIGMAK